MRSFCAIIRFRKSMQQRRFAYVRPRFSGFAAPRSGLPHDPAAAVGTGYRRPTYLGTSGRTKSGTSTREEHPYVDLATIYRTLQWLKGLGVVTEVIIGNKLHFEMSDHHNPHNHMVCSVCDGVQTLTPDYLAEFSRRLEQEFGFSPNLDNITIGGVCNQCRAVT